MPTIHAAVEAVIDATPDAVYGVLADYRQGHPSILPPKHLSGLEVVRGGVGAGTEIRFQVRLMGISRTVRARIDEPEPGVLVETDLETGAVTRFGVRRVDGGRRAAVAISTTWTTPGVRGAVERLLAPGLLRRVYAEELYLLNRHMVRQAREGARR